MQQLVGDKPTSANTNSFLRELFLQHLPSNMRMVLASADASMSMENLTDMADKVLEVASPQVPALQIPCPETPSEDGPSEVQLLCQEITCLATLVECMSTRPRSRGSSRPRHVATHTPPSTPQRSLCWYHALQGAVFVVFKLTSRTLVAMSTTGPHICRLFYVIDNVRGLRFLVDTGSEVSIIPPSLSECQQPNPPTTSH